MGRRTCFMCWSWQIPFMWNLHQKYPKLQPVECHFGKLPFIPSWKEHSTKRRNHPHKTWGILMMWKYIQRFLQLFRLLPVDHHVDATFLAKRGRFLVTVPAEKKVFVGLVFFWGGKRGRLLPQDMKKKENLTLGDTQPHKGVSKNRGTPKGMVYKNPIKMDDLGVPLFLETPITVNSLFPLS